MKMETDVPPHAIAGLGARFGGQIIDTVIAFLPLLLFSIAAYVIGLEDVFNGLILILGIAFSFFYVIFADGMSSGQSWGKSLLAIAVVDARTGEPCTYGQSFVRNFSLLVLSVIDWIFIFGASRRRLGDLIAGTVVVYVPRT